MLHVGKRHLLLLMFLYLVIVAVLKWSDFSDSIGLKRNKSRDTRRVTLNSAASRAGGFNQCRERRQLNGGRLLTLFTTFRDMADRVTIHRNTIHHWAALRPFGVQPLLYVVNPRQHSNTSWSTVDLARRLGWMTRDYHDQSTLSGAVQTVPVIRRMFLDAERASRSLFYGYANGDIMFDEGLPTTLLEIMEDLKRHSELLITGVRTDCVVDVSGDCGLMTRSSRSTTDHTLRPTVNNDWKGKVAVLRHRENFPSTTNATELFNRTFTVSHKALVRNGRVANSNWSRNATKSFRHQFPYQQNRRREEVTNQALKNAQDYFITTRSGFPWSTIPDFVVGRAGVDNWLLVTALARRATVIDASQTVTARHQIRPDYEPAAHFDQPAGDATVNYVLAGRSFDYSLGLTDCAPYETVSAARFHLTDDGCNRTLVLRRRAFNRYCRRAYTKLRRQISIAQSNPSGFNSRPTHNITV